MKTLLTRMVPACGSQKQTTSKYHARNVTQASRLRFINFSGAQRRIMERFYPRKLLPAVRKALRVFYCFLAERQPTIENGQCFQPDDEVYYKCVVKQSAPRTPT
jgi:hypothetical protein